MKDVKYTDIMGLTTERIANGGIFLNTMGDKANTMTIGWAFMGTSWGKPLFITMVRPQRYTYAAIEKAGEFSLSVPTKDLLKPQLTFAGTKSGRDLDKFEGHGITAAPARIVNAPIVAECGLHMECRTVYRREMTEKDLELFTLNKCYPQRDFHILYFGEILACYSTDD